MKLMGLFILMACITAISVALKQRTRRPPATAIKARRPLTANEEPMFFRLAEAFPDDVVLAQVAFSALITTTDRTARNRFDRKVADFVICSKAFSVKAIIELDDSSHIGKERQDAARTALLTAAGYKVLRYKRVPNTEQVRREVENKV